MHAELALPPELTIYNVGELCETWRATLAAAPNDGDADGAVYRLDGGAVEAVDAAGLQLVVSLANHLAGRQQRLVVERPTRLLKEACTMLGLAALLHDTPLSKDAA